MFLWEKLGRFKNFNLKNLMQKINLKSYNYLNFGFLDLFSKNFFVYILGTIPVNIFCSKLPQGPEK